MIMKWGRCMHKVKRLLIAEPRESPAAIDRRNSRRFKMFLPVHCQGNGFKEPFEMKTENINTSGLKYITHTRLSMDEIVTMRIVLHAPFPTLEIKGRVVWCEEKLNGFLHHYEGGIEFIQMSGSDFSMLECFINWYYFIVY